VALRDVVYSALPVGVIRESFVAKLGHVEPIRVGEAVQTVDRLAAAKVGLVTLKERIRIPPNGERDLAGKVMVSTFALMVELERDLLSARTKAGLARARAEGKRIGRPRGSTGKSVLDGREAEIKGFLAKGVSKASLARIVDVCPSTLIRFIRSRGLQAPGA